MFSLNSFQKIAISYWKNINKILYVYFAVIILTCASFFLLEFSGFSLKIPEYNLDNLSLATNIATILITIFGFGTALIGSLSIQYSLTKILVAYKYTHLLTIYFSTFLISSFITPDNNATILFLITIQGITSIFLLIHTLFLVDKVYEPEELMVEVIAPMIIAFENEKIENLHKEKKDKDISKMSALYGILMSSKNKPKPLINNDASVLFALTNVELENFGKAICRLEKSNSLRIGYLFSCIIEKLCKEKPSEVIFHEYFKDRVDTSTFGWFLLIYTIYFINISFPEHENESGHIKVKEITYTTLLSHILFTTLVKDNNLNKEYGNLNRSFSVMVNKLKDKKDILSFMKLPFNSDPDTFHEDAKTQVGIIYVDLIVDLIKKNKKNTLEANGYDGGEQRNIINLINMTNLILNLDEKTKSELNQEIGIPVGDKKWLISLCCELLVFIPSFDVEDYASTTYAKDNDIIKEFLINIFVEKWETSKVVLARKKVDEKFFIIKTTEYRDIFVNDLEEIELENLVAKSSKERVLLNAVKTNLEEVISIQGNPAPSSTHQA